MIRTAGLLRKQWPDIQFSSVYQTSPLLHEEQDDFLNAVARFESNLKPHPVLEHLTIIERTLEKDPPFPNGPRTIDLDVLLYDDLILEEADLVIPHRSMHDRRFVLEPLCELIDPEAKHPLLKQSWSELLAATKEQVCTPITLELLSTR